MNQSSTSDRSIGLGQGARILLVLVVVALATAPLLVPHPTSPSILPLPHVDRSALDRKDERERSLAHAAEQTLLPRSVRVVGELYRRLGEKMRAGREPYRSTLDDLRAETRALIEQGRQDELLTLRALQSELFVRAVHSFQTSRREPPELVELGADFALQAEASWLDESGQLLLTDEQLRLLFRVRWGRLTGTYRSIPFGPSLNEFRGYYGAYLEHPEGGLSKDTTSLAAARLRYVRALAKIDPDYPAAYASGVLLYQLGDARSAAGEFRRHLATWKSGTWNQAAKNHLLLASRATEWP